MKLPDFEAWAVFAKVAETGSFVAAARDLELSQATVSKAVGRLEARLGATLFHRTSRRLSLSDSGTAALERAARLLADGETLEADTSAQSTRPSGLVRMAAPMSFGIAHLGPVLPAFFALHPEITLDLCLSDHLVDVVEGGFDIVLRIADLEDSSLMARRLCPVRRLLVGSPAYFERHGRPSHPSEIARHPGLVYTGGRGRGAWRFEHPTHGEYSVAVAGPLRVDNADILRPALLAGAGLALQPDFLVWDDLRAGRLEVAMADWTAPFLALHLLTPPSTLRPARVRAVIAFLADNIAGAPWTGGVAPRTP